MARFAPSLEGVLTPDVEAEFRRGEVVKEGLALAEQRRVAEASARIEHCFVDGLGELKLRVHPDVYWRMVALYGRRCWSDKDFRESVWKKNPEARVKCRSRKTMVRVDGLRGGLAGTGVARTETPGGIMGRSPTPPAAGGVTKCNLVTSARPEDVR